MTSVRIGRSESFGPDGQASAIRKQAVNTRIALDSLGLAGDQQGDPLHHGGTDKALHHYPGEHYASWREELAARASEFEVGGFGENISTLGLIEADVCVGDVFRLGSATIQVSQVRQPCWKLNLRFGVADMARRVQDNGRTGWYYRVLQAGEIGAGDTLRRIERPHPDWPLTRLLAVLYRDCLDRDALAALAGLDALASNCRELGARRLATGAVENWLGRLNIPGAKA